MKKTIIILALFSICQMAIAQNNRLDDINTIKKSPNYLYAESTMRTAEEALMIAQNLLREEIIQWSREESDTPIDSTKAQELSLIADTMMMPRVDMIRVFAYIPKAIINPNVQPESEAPNPPKDSTLVNDTIKQKLIEHFTPKPINNRGGVLNRMMKARNFFELRDIMEPMKKNGEIVDYGKYATARDPANCYLIIYDPAGNIVAWLGTGKDKRQNLKTGKQDSEHNYRGCGAIWFKIKEQQ